MATRIAVVGHRRRLSMPADVAEWIAPDGRDVVRLPQRIRQGRIDRVVLIEADVTHGVVAPIMEACRSAGVSLAYCDKCTKTQIKSALDAITLGN